MDFFIENPIASRIVQKITPLLCIALGVLYLSSLSGKWQEEWDSAYYLTLTKTILSGNGFTYLGYPCLKCPPGFPLLLCPVMWLCKADIFWLNAYILFFAGIALAAIYGLFKTLFSHEYAIVLTFLTGISSLVLEYSGNIMIELPYLAVSSCALFFIQRYFRGKQDFFNGLPAALALLGGFFLRTVGIALIAGTFAYVVLHHRSILGRKHFWALTALIVIPIGTWMHHTKSVTVDMKDPIWQLQEFVPSNQEIKRFKYDNPQSQIVDIADIANRAIRNGTYYGGVLCSITTGTNIDTSLDKLHAMPKIILLAMVLPVCIMLIGFGHAVLKSRMPFNYYVIFYSAILFLWSSREPRYLLPMTPFILYYFLTGLALCFRVMKNKTGFFALVSTTIRVWGIIVFCLFYIGMHLKNDVSIIKSRHADQRYAQPMQDYLKAVEWIGATTQPKVRVASQMAPIAAYFSDRWCVSYPWVVDKKTLLTYLSKEKIDLVVVSFIPSNSMLKRERYFLPPLVSSYPEIFKRVFNSGAVYVYSIDPVRLQSALADYPNA